MTANLPVQDPSDEERPWEQTENPSDALTVWAHHFRNLMTMNQVLRWKTFLEKHEIDPKDVLYDTSSHVICLTGEKEREQQHADFKLYYQRFRRDTEGNIITGFGGDGMTAIPVETVVLFMDDLP